MLGKARHIRLTASILVASVVALAGLQSQPVQDAWAAESGKQSAAKKGKPGADPVVVMETTKGTIKIKVFTGEAPITANNFVDLVQRGFYNGLKFHRYEPGFVIQGGDPNGNGTGGFVDPSTHQERTIPLEKKPGLRHDSKGVVAMARSSNPNSASSQFYITLGPASFLDDPPGYAVFGKVVDGMPVVEELRAGDKMTKVAVGDGK